MTSATTQDSINFVTPATTQDSIEVVTEEVIPSEVLLNKDQKAKKVYVLSIEGTIEPGLVPYVERVLKESKGVLGSIARSISPSGPIFS